GGTDKTGVNTQTTIAVPDRVDKLGVIVSGPVGAPDRADKLGVIVSGPVVVPDRADLLGTDRGPGPVAVAAVPSSSSDSFAWNDAPVVAAAIFAVALLAAIGSLIARRRTDSTALAS